jgi:hypothetical protein
MEFSFLAVAITDSPTFNVENSRFRDGCFMVLPRGHAIAILFAAPTVVAAGRQDQLDATASVVAAKCGFDSPGFTRNLNSVLRVSVNTQVSVGQLLIASLDGNTLDRGGIAEYQAGKGGSVGNPIPTARLFAQLSHNHADELVAVFLVTHGFPFDLLAAGALRHGSRRIGISRKALAITAATANADTAVVISVSARNALDNL